MLIYPLFGFTLVEVLLSLVLLSCTLLGLDAMMIYSMRVSRATYYLTVATYQMEGIVQRLHALTRYEGLNQQISAWNLENKTVLPAGFGTVTGQYPAYTVRLYWGGKTSECMQVRLGQTGCLMEKISL